jgi:acyl carrier protein
MSTSVPDIRNVLSLVLTRLPEDTQVDFWDAGIVDSLSILDVVAALEERFGVEFDAETLKRENFSSLAAIARTLDGLRKAHEKLG